MSGCDRLYARRPAAWLRAVPLALLLLFPACRSSQIVADGYEADYDREIAAKAYGPALVSIKQALESDENEPRRWLKLAHLNELLDRPTGAADAYQHALDLQPYNVEALQNLAILHVRAGQYDTARQYIDPLLLLQPNDPAGLLTSGAVALYERRFADSDAIAARIIANNPNDPNGYILRARILERTGRSGAAIKMLQDRQKADPDSRDIASELMNAYRQTGDRDGIRRAAIQLMALFPDDPRYALESARAYHAMGQDDEAHRILDTLAKRYRRSVSVMVAVAGALLDIDPRAPALDRIVAIAGASPRHVEAALAGFLNTIGEPARVALLLAPMAGAPVNAATIDLQAAYARALYALGRTAEVSRKIDAILAFDKVNPTALILRAHLAYARGDYLKAATDAGVVASDDDTNEEAALMVAQIYAAQGNPVLASKAYADAHDGFPDSPTVVRAQTEWLLGQKRTSEAVDIAAAFAHTHSGRPQPWLVYRDICAGAGDALCLAEARRALAGFTS